MSPSVFNPYSGGGITLGNLFRGWPRERIAAVHGEIHAPDPNACSRYYRLRSDELGGLLPRLGRRSAGPSVPVDPAPAARSTQLVARLRSALALTAERVLSRGVRDRARLSAELSAWIRDYRPDLVYSLLGSTGFVRLVRAIADQTSAPVVVHMMDDWPETRYRGGLLGPWFHAQADRELRALLARSAARLAICQPMRREYEERYGLAFEAFHNVLDAGEWRPRVRREWATRRPARIVYAGSLLPEAQLESVSDVAACVGRLRRAGQSVELHLHSTLGLADPHRARLERPPAVVFGLAPESNDVARLLAEADVLLLPANFDRRSVAYIRLSFPTKIPAYLLSGTPILAYGPPETAQIRMALDEGWADVVERRDPAALAAAIERLLGDAALRERLGRRAQEVGFREHAAEQVRPRFHETLSRAALVGASAEGVG